VRAGDSKHGGKTSALVEDEVYRWGVDIRRVTDVRARPRELRECVGRNRSIWVLALLRLAP
jgi:hypothetical protein